MRRRLGVVAVMMLLLVDDVAFAQATPKKTAPIESKHQRGADGWEGWTLNYPMPDSPQDIYPMTLVLAHRGHIVHRIEGDAFVWNWMFLAEGHQIAYETGPLHFGMRCVLIETATAKTLADYDCWRELPADAPDWVKKLEALK